MERDVDIVRGLTCVNREIETWGKRCRHSQRSDTW